MRTLCLILSLVYSLACAQPMPVTVRNAIGPPAKTRFFFVLATNAVDISDRSNLATSTNWPCWVTYTYPGPRDMIDGFIVAWGLVGKPTNYAFVGNVLEVRLPFPPVPVKPKTHVRVTCRTPWTTLQESIDLKTWTIATNTATSAVFAMSGARCYRALFPIGTPRTNRLTIEAL